MRLIHYSCAARVPSHVREDRQRVGTKPLGLWVSVEGEDDWPSFCVREDFSVRSLACATEVVLARSANVLVLTNSDELLAFSREYGVKGMYRLQMKVDWPRVACAYDGIIIAPYIWECRLHEDAGWYYGWDCASGCLWRASTVHEFLPYHVAREALEESDAL
jgi:hypothetical protein